MSLNEADLFGVSLGETINEQENIKQNLSPEETDVALILFATENVEIFENAIHIKKRDVSTDTLWDFDSWDVAIWDEQYNNEPVTQYIYNPNNEFREYFYTTNYKDSTNTTADWTTVGSLTFSSAIESTAISTPIKYNTGILKDVTVSVAGTNATSADIYISPNNGVTWYEVSSGVKQTLAYATANTSLLWKIDNNQAGGGLSFPTPFGSWGDAYSSDIVLTELKIKYSTY